MALRLVQVIEANESECVAKIYRDTEWDEFIVRMEGEETYHAEDKADAVATAHVMLGNRPA